MSDLLLWHLGWVWSLVYFTYLFCIHSYDLGCYRYQSIDYFTPISSMSRCHFQFLNILFSLLYKFLSPISVLLIVTVGAQCRLLLKGTKQWEAMPLKGWSLDLMISRCSFGNLPSTSTPKLAWQAISRCSFFPLFWSTILKYANENKAKFSFFKMHCDFILHLLLGSKLSFENNFWCSSFLIPLYKKGK